MEPGRDSDPAVLSVRVRGSGPADRELRRLVAGVLGLPPAEVVLGHRPSGAPVVLDPADQVWVSVSRGPAVLAVAACRCGPVGVDVERLRPLPAVPLARRWLSTVDVDWVARQPADRRPAAFLRLWTQKEAVGKARGIGLAGGGRHAPVPRPDQLRPAGPLVLDPVPDAAGLAVGAVERAGLVLAVCAPAAAGAPRVDWDLPG